MRLHWLVLGCVGVPAASAAASFECLIEPAQVVEIRAPVEGLIAKVHVQRGDAVHKGQVLVELSSGVEMATVQSAQHRAKMEGQISAARSRLDYATKKLGRMKELYQKNFVSAQARDEADAERRLAESELQAAMEARELAQLEHQRAMEQLALRSLRSPFNGVVVDRLLNPGDLAESGTGRKPALKLAQIDPLRVDVVLPAAAFGQVKRGARASVRVHGSTARYHASVKLIDKVIDSASGTFVARLELPNPKHAVPGGARCRAEIEGVEVPGDKDRGAF